MEKGRNHLLCSNTPKRYSLPAYWFRESTRHVESCSCSWVFSSPAYTHRAKMNLPAAETAGYRKTKPLISHILNNFSCPVRRSTSDLSKCWFLIYLLITSSLVASPTVPIYLPSLQNSPPHNSSFLSFGKRLNTCFAVIDFINCNTWLGLYCGLAPQKIWMWSPSKPSSSIIMLYLSLMPFIVSRIHSSTSGFNNALRYFTAVTKWYLIL